MCPSRALKFAPLALLRFVMLCAREELELCCPACKLNCETDGGYSREEVSGAVREELEVFRRTPSGLLRALALEK